jgi:mRNA interferase RelE/StbE
MEIESKEGNKEILLRLAKLQSDMDYLREHIADITLTEDDLESIREAKKDLKEGKTRRLWKLMYFVELSQNTQKFLDKMDISLKYRIERSLKKLEEVPVPSDSKFVGRDNKEKIFRLRIGKYRALYSINDETKIVLVINIDKRERVYQ